MRIMMLVGSCFMLIISAIMAVMQIKEKKRITDPYVILAIITFLVAFGMIFKMMGISC